jgi:hypothetical protein
METRKVWIVELDMWDPIIRLGPAHRSAQGKLRVLRVLLRGVCGVIKRDLTEDTLSINDYNPERIAKA